jgi:hypothetical protein
VKPALAVVLAALLLAGLGTAAAPGRERIVFALGGELYASAPDGTGSARLTRNHFREAAPSLSPDGTQIAFVSDRDGNDEIYVLALQSREVTRLTTNPGLIDTRPSWSPDGKRIAYASGVAGELDVYLMNADGSGKRALVVAPGDDAEPSWSPGGRQIAFASNRAGSYDVWVAELEGGEPKQFTADLGDEREPAWAPVGARIAFVSNRDGNDELYATSRTGLEIARLTDDAAPDRRPAWSPDGRRIAFARASAIYAMDVDSRSPMRVAEGGEPSWGRVPAPAPPRAPAAVELLPDLEQRAPRGLTVTSARGRRLLGFASATDNIGRGPLWIRAGRPSTFLPTMTATQLIRLSNGTVRSVPSVGVLRYTYSASHSHWHLLRFQTYELRRADGFELVVRDRKSGFCLADHYGHAATRVRGFRPPRFLGNCGKGRPDLLSMQQGTSIGYTDRYPAHYHGQNVDVTGVRAGRYWLVHRANASGRLQERTFANNAASVLLRLAWPGGPRALPRVDVLRVCEGRERC